MAKHANVRKAYLDVMAREGNLHIQVRDSGVGFNYSKVPNSSTGLMGMRERVTMLGGTIAIESRPGAGTQVVVSLPTDKGGTDDKAYTS